jgi:hypothetical protein
MFRRNKSPVSSGSKNTTSKKSACSRYQAEAARSSETSADFKRTTRHYLPEDRTLQCFKSPHFVNNSIKVVLDTYNPIIGHLLFRTNLCIVDRQTYWIYARFRICSIETHCRTLDNSAGFISLPLRYLCYNQRTEKIWHRKQTINSYRFVIFFLTNAFWHQCAIIYYIKKSTLFPIYVESKVVAAINSVTSEDCRLIPTRVSQSKTNNIIDINFLRLYYYIS